MPLIIQSSCLKLKRVRVSPPTLYRTRHIWPLRHKNIVRNIHRNTVIYTWENLDFNNIWKHFIQNIYMYMNTPLSYIIICPFNIHSDLNLFIHDKEFFNIKLNNWLCPIPQMPLRERRDFKTSKTFFYSDYLTPWWFFLYFQIHNCKYM